MSIVQLDIGDGGGSAGDDAKLIEALRLRAAEGLERAYDFIEKEQDVWAKLRSAVLCGARPAADLTEAIAAQQATDGRLPISTLISGGAIGFPPTATDSLGEDARAIVGTLESLLMAADAKILHGHWVERAAHALEGLQSEDGAFRVPAEGDSPAAAQADVFWTGMVAGVMGRTPVSRPSMLAAAGEFLAERFEPESVEQEGYSALLAYAHFFTNVAHDLADETLQWCGRALEKGFRSRQLDTVSTVRVLLTCDAQALPGATFDVTELLERLLEEQAGDGGFAELSPEGPAGRTTQTFDAMLGIVRLCAAIDERG
ncbi:MAG: hypothetical protein VCB25_02030 [Myxococcota bacterium]